MLSDVKQKLPFEIICWSHHHFKIRFNIFNKKLDFIDKKCRKKISIPFSFRINGKVPILCCNSEMELSYKGSENDVYNCKKCNFRIRLTNKGIEKKKFFLLYTFLLFNKV